MTQFRSKLAGMTETAWNLVRNLFRVHFVLNFVIFGTFRPERNGIDNTHKWREIGGDSERGSGEIVWERDEGDREGYERGRVRRV